MGIEGYSKDEFGRRLGTVVNPATPIRSIEHLKGRDQQLEEIERALYAVGRHVFIFGDRGVGKSSLAATAAYQYQSGDAEPIFVSGSPDETFKSIIVNVALQGVGRSKLQSVKRQTAAGFDFRGLRISASNETSFTDLSAQVNSVSDATELLRQVSSLHSQCPTVVLDEFDAIPDIAERSRFAALLKQMGDQSIPIKFLITGVGQSCQELLGAHSSAHRQLATIELMRLSFEGRREIVKDAARAFGLRLDDNVNWRIALISDGYPYYVHLLVEKMLWAAFDSADDEPELGMREFYDGLRVAVKETNAELRTPYEKAVLQRGPEYEDVVFSSADGDDLFRNLQAMYDSYVNILNQRPDRPVLDRGKYAEVVRRLREPSHGAMLKSLGGRNGWYEYREKMIRGYVRMQAEANNIQLNGERSSPRQAMHIANIRTGSYGPSVPRGVRQTKPVR